ncbi:MAG: hypothetical protein ABDH20_03365, partial [Thermus sp.]
MEGQATVYIAHSGLRFWPLFRKGDWGVLEVHRPPKGTHPRWLVPLRREKYERVYLVDANVATGLTLYRAERFLEKKANEFVWVGNGKKEVLQVALEAPEIRGYGFWLQPGDPEGEEVRKLLQEVGARPWTTPLTHPAFTPPGEPLLILDLPLEEALL